jgi:hypothetical protein
MVYSAEVDLESVWGKGSDDFCATANTYAEFVVRALVPYVT